MQSRKLQNGKYRVCKTDLIVDIFTWDGLFCTLETIKKHFSDEFIEKVKLIEPNDWRVLLIKSKDGKETIFNAPMWVDLDSFKSYFVYVCEE